MVIKEFFQFYNMDYSNCVFASEANARTEVKRDQLIEKLGLTGKVEAGKPILTYIIEVSRFRSYRNSKQEALDLQQQQPLARPHLPPRAKPQSPPHPHQSRNPNKPRSNKNSTNGFTARARSSVSRPRATT